MRRKELAATEPEFFATVAGRAPVGYLALPLPGGDLRAVALDFAAVGQSIYFHGATAGQKYDVIAGNERAPSQKARIAASACGTSNILSLN